MASKKVKTAIDELAEKADAMLLKCWEKLAAKDVTRDDVEAMVEGWGLKYKVFLEKEAEKEAKK